MNRNDNNGFRCVLVVAGGKALMRPNNRRELWLGRKPCPVRAKREPKPGGSTPEKTEAWTGAPPTTRRAGLAIPAEETHRPCRGKDAAPARGHAARVTTGDPRVAGASLGGAIFQIARSRVGAFARMRNLGPLAESSPRLASAP